MQLYTHTRTHSQTPLFPLYYNASPQVGRHSHLFCFYSVDIDKIARLKAVFNDLVRRKSPQLHTRLTDLDVFPDMWGGVFMNWMQTMFLKCLPLELTSRVWDCFLLGDAKDGSGGVGLLFKVTLSILDLLSPFIFEPNTCDSDLGQILNGFHSKGGRPDIWCQYVLGADQEGQALLNKMEKLSLPDVTLRSIATIIQ